MSLPGRSWHSCLFFIVEAIDDYLYTDEHRSDGSVRTIYSGPTRARLLGGEPPPGTSPSAEWERLVHPDDRASYEAHGERLNSGKPSDVLYRLQGYDGVIRRLHGRARPRNSDGRVFVDGIMSDVTRRVDAELALTEAEQDLRRQLKLNEYQAHHDHLTGLGNRRLLVAAEALIEARIVAVCDAFSALTSCRPDRDARTPAEALDEIRRRSATQFDPAVVEALAAALADLGQSSLAHAERRAS